MKTFGIAVIGALLFATVPSRSAFAIAHTCRDVQYFDFTKQPLQLGRFSSSSLTIFGNSAALEIEGEVMNLVARAKSFTEPEELKWASDVLALFDVPVQPDDIASTQAYVLEKPNSKKRRDVFGYLEVLTKSQMTYKLIQIDSMIGRCD